MSLGVRRAAEVKQRLIESGVAPERIALRTRGALDAIGGKLGYDAQYDRRVDLLLRN